MNIPEGILNGLQQAWQNQTRWICATSSIAQQPICCYSLPQGDPASPLGLTASLSEALRRIMQTSPGAVHMLYLDDRTWLTQTSQQCIDISLSWEAEVLLLGLTENTGKRDFAANNKADEIQLQQTLNTTNINGRITDRPRTLGTFLRIQNQDDEPTPEEANRLKKANKLIQAASSIPASNTEKLFYARSTGLALANSNGWSRLPTMKDINTLRSSMAMVNKRNYTLGDMGPLFRMFQGHSFDPAFSIGYSQVVHILTGEHNIGPYWTNRKTAGPQHLIKTWLQRHGWKQHPEQAWTWQHPDIHTTICPRSHDREALEHELRDAWRAKQWSLFIKCRSKAAQTLSHLTWPHVRQRFNLARSTLQDTERRPHLLAIYTNHWVSQARFDYTRNIEVKPCFACGHDRPDRQHEWVCPALRQTVLAIPDDPLSQTMAWPRPGANFDTELAQDLADIRQRILAIRYPHDSSSS